MTAAPELSADERARVAAFDAAPQLAESAPMTRAMLALAEKLDGLEDSAHREASRYSHNQYDAGRGDAYEWAAERLRETVAAVLAADPEPREGVIERMARAMWAAEHGVSLDGWALVVATTREHWRRLGAAALDASRGGTQ